MDDELYLELIEKKARLSTKIIQLQHILSDMSVERAQVNAQLEAMFVE